MRALALLLLFGTAVGGCSHAPVVVTDLATHRGQRITVEGVAERRKFGAALRADGFEVWVDLPDNWPDAAVGQRVRATGVLEERHDLPVFVPDPDPSAPVSQGMPVAEGTDLQEASQRWVLTQAEWRLEP